MNGGTRDVEALRGELAAISVAESVGIDDSELDTIVNAVLASDWLAEHDAEVEARVREQVAQAIEATPGFRWASPTLVDRDRAAHIARGAR